LPANSTFLPAAIASTSRSTIASAAARKASSSIAA
jgi:hypothetical protein